MLYHEINAKNIEGIENYIITIAPQGDTKDIIVSGNTTLSASVGSIKFWKELKGIMNDKSIELPFGVKLTNEGEIGGGGILGMANTLMDSYANKFGDKMNKVSKGVGMIQKARDMIGGAVTAISGTNPMERQAIYTVTKPDTWSKPDISFKCTYYKGMKIGSFETPEFKEFCKKLMIPLLPARKDMYITAFLENTQLGYDTLIRLIGEGIKIKGSGSSTDAFGFSVQVGKVLNISSGLWLKEAKIEAPTIFDSKGNPLVWDVDYSFEYYKQPTIDEVQKWLR